ncbi:MAG: YesL family protein [Clostridiales bacterium]|nr:YesL family protein [Clostridiales bacterium]MCD8366558.1 YesL family protein [Clostridiales bacterium]
MFRQVFDPNNLFWRLISKGVDFVGLSLFWAALSLPIVTAGPATAALYYTVVKTFRHKEDGAFGIYWKSFVQNLRRGIPATLIFLPVMLLIFYGYSIMYANATSDLGVVMFVAYYVALVVPVGLFCYLFPIMGRFDLKLKELFQTSFALCIRHLPTTLILVLLVVELVIFVLERWWPIFFVPVLTMLLFSLFLERIFPKYLNEEERAVFEDRFPEDEEEE